MLDTADVLGGHSRAPKSFEVYIADAAETSEGFPTQLTIADTKLQSSRLYLSSGFVPDSYAKMTRLMCCGWFALGLAVGGFFW